jgi:hypothetical protein
MLLATSLLFAFETICCLRYKGTFDADCLTTLTGVLLLTAVVVVEPLVQRKLKKREPIRKAFWRRALEVWPVWKQVRSVVLPLVSVGLIWTASALVCGTAMVLCYSANLVACEFGADELGDQLRSFGDFIDKRTLSPFIDTADRLFNLVAGPAAEDAYLSNPVPICLLIIAFGLAATRGRNDILTRRLERRWTRELSVALSGAERLAALDKLTTLELFRKNLPAAEAYSLRLLEESLKN